jgi:hypothetical protein
MGALLLGFGIIGQIAFIDPQDVTQGGAFAQELIIYGLILMITSPIVIIVSRRRK